MEQFEIESEFSTTRKHFSDGVIDITAGTCGGIVSVYVGQPLDTIKVKMQTFPKLYPSGYRCFMNTLRLDGVRGLYAGTVPSLIASVAENAVLFAAYGYCRKLLCFIGGCSSTEAMSPVENAAAGSLAACFAVLVLCPTELVKCKLQALHKMDASISSTPTSVCRDMYRSGGLSSFSTGLVPTLIREVPGYFCFFGAYELSRYCLTDPGKTKTDIGLFRTALSGSIGGMALWGAIYPIDVVKSRIQVSGHGSFHSTLFNIFRNEGIKTLYKGLSATLLRTFIASGCLFITYEESKKLFSDLLCSEL